jgi:hypothetical protein
MSRDYTKLVAEWELIVRYREYLATGGTEGLRRWLTQVNSEHKYERLASKNTECMKADNAVVFANEKIARYRQFLPTATVTVAAPAVTVAAPAVTVAPPPDERLRSVQQQIVQLRQDLAVANLRITQFTMLSQSLPPPMPPPIDWMSMDESESESELEPESESESESELSTVESLSEESDDTF